MVHAWHGSVVELRYALRDLVRRQRVDERTRVFFDALCLYLPDDVYDVEGAASGLLQAEQMEVSTRLLHSERQHTRTRRPAGLDLFVMHSARCPVYSRAWALHEMATSAALGLRVRHAFDVEHYAQMDDGQAAFAEAVAATPGAERSDCSRWQDKVMLFQRMRAFELQLSTAPKAGGSPSAARAKVDATQKDAPNGSASKSEAVTKGKDPPASSSSAPTAVSLPVPNAPPAPSEPGPRGTSGLVGFDAVSEATRRNSAAARKALRSALSEYEALGPNLWLGPGPAAEM